MPKGLKGFQSGDLNPGHKNKGHKFFVRKIYYNNIKKATFDILGNKCVKCGFLDERALQIDHINGGGRKERMNMVGTTFYKFVLESVLKEENRYQLLCANCNWIKRHENNER